MKTEISSLPEVIESLLENAKFLARLSTSLGVPLQTESVKMQQSSNGKMPQGMSQQVIQILSDANHPLKPKEIVSRHIELGWSPSGMSRSKLYESVAGSLSYLVNRKGVLTRTKKGYSIKEEEKK